MSRTKYAFKNVAFAMFSKIFTLLINFVSRTVFIYYLGNTCLGINSLFTEMLQVLSFAELGFGTAMNFALYKPVAENDDATTLKLLDYYKKVYRIIALVIVVFGLALLPFLSYVVKDADVLTINELRIYYIFFLINTVTGYFVSYKYSLVNAQQKNYITTNFEFVSGLVIAVFQIVVICCLKNYFAYLVTHTVLLIVSRFVLSTYLNKRFPLLKKHPDTLLSAEEKKPIHHEVKGLVFHQFSSVAIHQTDNILIASFIEKGIQTVGFISNYNMIIHAVNGMLTLVFNSVVSGYGNLIATSKSKDLKRVFEEANFINFWLYGFSSIAFYILIPPFITLWLGKDFLIERYSFLLIVVNCYLLGQSIVYSNIRTAYGKFTSDGWISLIQALLNLVVSVVCASMWGLLGVYVGTIVSRIFFVLVRPAKTYKMMFDEGVGNYYKTLFSYGAIVLIAGILTQVVVRFLHFDNAVISFVVSCIVVLLLPNAVFGIIFARTRIFKSVMGRLQQITIKKGE